MRAVRLGLLLMLVWPAVARAQVPITGTLASNTSITAGATAQGTASVTLVGTWSGTVNFKVSNGGPPAVVSCSTPDGSGGISTTALAGTWTCPIAAFNQFIVEMTGYVSGSAAVTILTGPGGGASSGGGGGGGSGDFTNSTYNNSFGTAGVADTQVQSVQGIAGMTALLTAGNRTNNTAVPGATNAGALTAVATTAAPTYTDGNMVALSTDTAGALRVSGVLSSGASDTDDGTVAGGQPVGLGAGLNYVWGGATWGRLTFGQAAMTGSLPVVIASNQSAVPVSGTVTANPSNTANTTPWYVTVFPSGGLVAGGSGAWTSTTIRTITATDDPMIGRFGEVQTTPTTNTLLGRLKDVYDRLVLVDTKLDTIDNAISGGNGWNISAIGGVVPSDAQTFDYDSGGGTVTREAVGLMVPASGGPVVVPGSATTGMYVDVRALPAGGTTAPIASTSGGCTPGKLISAASTNSTSVSGTTTQLYSLQVINFNAAARYLKLYSKATAPTVGTDVPLQTLAIPPNSTTGGGFILPIPVGMEFPLGLGLALTTGSADADTGAVAAGDIVVNYCRKS